MKIARLKSPLKNISIYSSKGLLVMYGYDEYTGLYSILEINRPAITTEGIIKIKQYQNNLSLNQIITRKKYMKTSYKDMELLYENIPAIYGCIKLLESYYLIIITKITKVGSIVGHSIYTIDETTTIPITYGMKNSTDETRYKSLLNTFDFSKYLYFSYTYDLTKSWQSQMTTVQNIDQNNSNSSHRLSCQHMFVWNSYALKPFLRGGNSGESLDYWCVPVIYGYINQRNIQLNSNIILKFLLIARRSRLFAGTRYLRRGVDDLGHVANEVETEQIFYILSSQPGYVPRITSLVQCRGSIPLFWSHTNLYSPKPDVQLESDLTMRQMAAKKHFENLFIRYGFNINVLNLVKQIDSKGEMMLGTAYKETCESLSYIFTDMRKYHKKSLQKNNNGNIDNNHNNNNNEDEDEDILPIKYIAYDFLTMAKYQHIAETEGLSGPNVFRDVNKISEKIFPTVGFYVDPPYNKNKNNHDNKQTKYIDSNELNPSYFHFPIKHELKQVESGIIIDILNEMLEIDSDVNYTSDDLINQFNTINSLGEGSPYGLLQNGILRTNCMDCLDRTNVAQFCYAKLNIYKQLKSIGLSLLSSGLQEVINICMEVWAEHGDAIAIQYGGSGAMHKVDKQETGNSTPNNNNNNMSESPISTSILLSNNNSNNLNNSTNINSNNNCSSNNVNVNVNSNGNNIQSVSSDQEFRLTGGSKNALVAVQRYYSNIATDYDRQQSIDLLLGIYEPKKNATPIWEEKLRTQHLRHGTRGRRQSDITASVQHDLNLLLELDKVTKKEKVRRELLILQSNQLNSKSSDGENGNQNVSGDGGFMILNEEDDNDDEEDEDDEDEEEDNGIDDEEDEIWEDNSNENEEKKGGRQSRKSIRIPIPGYNILNLTNQAYFHIGSLSMSSFTEFSDVIEDDNITKITLDEVNVYPFPPVLTNETMWSYWQLQKQQNQHHHQQQQQQQQQKRAITSSNCRSLESNITTVQQTKILLPQEQLYSDYLNLNYTFTPGIQVICNCSNSSSISTTQSLVSNSNIVSSPQISKQLQQERRFGDSNLIETLKQEIMKECFTNQNFIISSQSQQYQPRLSLQERVSDATDNNSSMRESEIQNDLPKSVNSSPVPPISTPVPSSTSSQSSFSITKSGIWPFRKTVKSKPVNDIPVDNSFNSNNNNNNNSNLSSGIDSKGLFGNSSQGSKNRTDSVDSINSNYLPNTRRIESTSKKNSRLYENLLKSYIDNTIQEKIESNLIKEEKFTSSKDYKTRISDVE